jgi:hypothetical protein
VVKVGGFASTNVDNVTIQVNGEGDLEVLQTGLSIVPVGGIIPWLKTLTNTPALGDQFVECNGQTLSDAESVYDGITLPDLNGNSGSQMFLRGSTTSGSTGGADTHKLPSHDHSILGRVSLAGGTSDAAAFGSGASGNITGGTGSTGSGNAHNNLPSYYEVVWVMRVK